MKNKYIIIGLFLISLLGCNKFLAEVSQDKFIPKTVSDFREYIAGDGFDINNSQKSLNSEFLEMMTDDVEDYMGRGSTDYRLDNYGYYSWSKNPEYSTKTNNFQYDLSWNSYYNKIIITNIILSKIETMQGEDKKEREDLRAEAHFLRAWSYFQLVNSYAEPFENEEQAKKTKAVPVNKFSDIIDRTLEIGSLYDVYQIILDDLNKAITSFSESNINKANIRPNLATAQLLVSRVNLYLKDYKKCIEYSNKVIDNKDYTLYNISDKSKDEIRFISQPNTEIIYSYGNNTLKTNPNYLYGRSYCLGGYRISKNLLSEYYSSSNMDKTVKQEELSDKRLIVFFTNDRETKTTIKYDKLKSNKVKGYAFRLAEAYLNRAEAFCESGELNKALDDINMLRKYRVKDVTPLASTDKEEVLNWIKRERRIELCFEGHRWFDLRRWGRPEIKHKYHIKNDDNEVEVFVLKEKDERYTLAFPYKETIKRK